MHMLVVTGGSEVIGELTAQAAEAAVADAAIVSLIGAVDTCLVSNLQSDDPRLERFLEYEEPMLMSGTGEIRDGKVHIHATLSREGDHAVVGNLHRAIADTYEVRAYVIPIPAGPYGRH
ncbi:PCC domain-containing protein [Micromonospora chersina]|uniref:PCC domain-containing protein n=1 Tax=Micromonospora chersina TaxID=47854 RepID=UPI0037ADCAE4